MLRAPAFAVSAMMLGSLAMPVESQQEASWCFGFETTDDLTTGYGTTSDGIQLSLNETPEYLSEGAASVRLSARSQEGAEGNHYVSLIVPAPGLDVEGKMIAFDAWTSLPGTTRALYVRSFDADGKCVLSWQSWAGPLAASATHRFELQPGLSLHGMNWEQKMVAAPGQPVARFEFIIGTGEHGVEYDVYLDNLCVVPSKYRGFDEVTEPNQRHPRTTLVEAGQPSAVIIRPEDAAFDAPVQHLVDGVRDKSGAVLPVATDAEAREDLPAAIESMAGSHTILIGSINSNRAMLPLYSHAWCYADSVFPGAGGYELRVVQDPWGAGKNVVVIGAADAEGASAAVDELLALLPQSPDVALEPLVKVALTDEAQRRWSKQFEQDLGEAYLESALEDAGKRIESGAHGGLAPLVASCGEAYALTGREEYARAFVLVARRWKEHHDSNPDTYGGPWGMDADFSLYRLMPAWDAVEECPALTDEERLEVTRILFEFITTDCVRKAAGVLGNERVRFNHQTFPALGLCFAGEYFSKHYNLAEAVYWLEIADGCFGMQAKAFKPYEDCNGYQWLTLGHLVRYALSKPDFTYFENGNARKDADYAIMSMDNLGYQVTYGDTGAFTGWWSELPLLWAAAWYYDDPGYRWAAARKQELSGRVSLNECISAGEQAPPAHLLGAKAFELDPYYYQTFGGPKAMPIEQTVDKVAMRTGFGSGDQYLLLDGLSNGGHKHYDGNSIPRWTGNDRIWLADADYIKSLPKYHNGVLIFKDGSSQTIPDFCELEHLSDMPRAALSTTTLPDYAGVDWRRNILWLKGVAFIVGDQMRAYEDGSYSFRPIWQTVGDVRQVGNGMTIDQHGQYAAVASPGTGRALLTDDPLTGKNWSAYDYADEPIVRVLQQVYNADLTAGQSRTLFTVLRASGEQPPNVKVTSPAEGLMYADIDGTQVVAGVIPPGTEARFLDLAIEADAFVATSDVVTVFGLRSLSYMGQSLSADEPVDIEVDLAQFRATVDAKQATSLFTPYLGETPIEAGRSERDLPPDATIGAQLMGELLARAASMPAPTPPGSVVPDDLPQLRQVFSYHEKLPAYLLTNNPGAFEAVDAGAELSCEPEPLPRNVFSGEEGTNLIRNLLDGELLTTGGSVMWDEGQTVTVRVKLDSAYDISAVRLKAWHATSSSKGKVFQIHSIRVEGSDDGFDADVRLLAEVTDTEPHPNWGGEPRKPHVYSLDGIQAQARELRLTIVPRMGDEIEVPPDAEEKPAAAGVYLAELEVWGNREGLDVAAQTDAVASVPAHTFGTVAAADVDGDGVPELIAGSSNSNVYLLGSDGTVRWSFDTGGAVNSVATVNILDGGPAIVAGSSGAVVTALRPDGELLWQFSVPYYKRTAHVRTVFGANLGDGKAAVIAGCDNWRYYAIDESGKELWHYESVHGSTAGAAGDVDGDGRDEIACGTEYYWWHLVSADGEKVWSYSTRTGPTANAAAMGDIDGDGKLEVLFGGADANVHAINSEGKLLWQFNTGDEVTALACSDVDGDGADEVIVGSLSFNVYAVKGDGTLLWRRDLGWPVSDLCVAGDANGARVCAVTDEGRVCVLNAADGDWVGTLPLAASGLRIAGLPEAAGDSPKVVGSSADGNLFGLTW
jgi:hypothetical protein